MSSSKMCCVIGTGFLGSRITGELSRLGLNVNVYDQDLTKLNALNSALLQQKSELEENGLCARDNSWGTVTTCSVLHDAVSGVDFIFEAVVENADVKRWLFQKITHNCDSQAILCSNTFTVDLNEVVSESLFKERILGCRFLIPVYCIPLVEISVSNFTSSEVIRRLEDFFNLYGIQTLRKVDGNPRRLKSNELSNYWNVQKNRVRTLNMVVNVQTHSASSSTTGITQETTSSLINADYALHPRVTPDEEKGEINNAVTTAHEVLVSNSSRMTGYQDRNMHGRGHVHETLDSGRRKELVVNGHCTPTPTSHVAFATTNVTIDNLVSLHNQQMKNEEVHKTSPVGSASIDSKEECVVCNERNYDSVLIPCGHMWLCYECACHLKSSNQNCPACRHTIHSIVRVYKP